jgi:hypothetical protein
MGRGYDNILILEILFGKEVKRGYGRSTARVRR